MANYRLLPFFIAVVCFLLVSSPAASEPNTSSPAMPQALHGKVKLPRNQLPSAVTSLSESDGNKFDAVRNPLASNDAGDITNEGSLMRRIFPIEARYPWDDAFDGYWTQQKLLFYDWRAYNEKRCGHVYRDKNCVGVKYVSPDMSVSCVYQIHATHPPAGFGPHYDFVVTFPSGGHAYSRYHTQCWADRFMEVVRGGLVDATWDHWVLGLDWWTSSEDNYGHGLSVSFSISEAKEAEIPLADPDQINEDRGQIMGAVWNAVVEVACLKDVLVTSEPDGDYWCERDARPLGKAKERDVGFDHFNWEEGQDHDAISEWVYDFYYDRTKIWINGRRD